MKGTLPLLAILALAAAVPPRGTAAEQADPGEAPYRLGLQLLDEGKPEQARLKLEESLLVSPQGPFADDALLAAASVDYPVADLDQVGQSAARLPEEWERARRSLASIVDRFPAANTVPQAAFRLGLLQMDSANPRGSLEGALVSFRDVARLFPRTPAAAEAIEAAGECALLLGDRAASAGEDVRLLVTYSQEPAARRAGLRLAMSAARLGELPLARRLLGAASAEAQALKDGDARPEPPSGRSEPGAAGAEGSRMRSLRARARLFQRLLARAVAERPDRPGSRTLDERFGGVSAALGETAALAADREGGLWALDAETRSVLKIPATGDAPSTAGTARGAGGTGDAARLEARATEAGAPAIAGVEPARGLALDRAGRVYLWGEKSILLPGGRRVEPRGPAGKDGSAETLRKILGIAIGPRGEIDVIDGAGDRILRYAPDLSLKGEVAAFEDRPAGIVSADDGTLYVLIPSRREIRIISAPSAALQTSVAMPPPSAAAHMPAVVTLPLVGEGWKLTSPVGLAVDSLGRVYVLDAASRSVTVLDAAGRRVAMIAPARGSAGEFRSPAAIAVDGAGDVYVADRRLKRILRFR